MRRKKEVLITCILMLGIYLCSAQEVVPAAGGNASGSGGSASYTVGQITYTTITSETGSVAQGVQHPFVFDVNTGAEVSYIKLKMNVYPNPTINQLYLMVEDLKDKKLTYSLYNIEGKLVNQQKITAPTTLIDMNGLAPATYLLGIRDQGAEVKSFSIIKMK